jgi:ribulose 1,5-bisphosphate synthetase/thiazole synthase
MYEAVLKQSHGHSDYAQISITLSLKLKIFYSFFTNLTTREKNMDKLPEKINWNREIPVSYTAEVVVIGGGIAGACAACASASMGKQTILIERFAMLGGNGTVGGVSGFCGETRGVGNIFDEIISDLEQFNAINDYTPPGRSLFQSRGFDHEILAVVLQEIVLRYGVKLLFHTRFIDVEYNQQSQEVEHIIIAGKSGPEAIRSKFYIDCTGEADVVFQAGLETIKGGKNIEYQLPMSLMFFVRKGLKSKKKKYVPDNYFDWQKFQKRSDLPMTSPGPYGHSGKSVKIKIPKYDSSNTESLTQAEIQGHRKMMQVLHYYQKVEKKKWEFDHCASIIGIREGRRIIGEYYLVLEDLRAGKSFEDGVAVGTFPLDGHKPDDDKRTYILPRSELKVPYYQIPLRSLIPKKSKNLLVAGRNLSADQLSLSSARVMTTCAMMGIASGVTAVKCIDLNMNPIEIATKKPDLVRSFLVENGTKLDLDWYNQKN